MTWFLRCGKFGVDFSIGEDWKMTVNVVKRESRDECPKLVEVIERKGKQAYIKQGKTWCRDGAHKYISYKSRKYKTFFLPKCYDDCSGNCIDISNPSIYW